MVIINIVLEGDGKLEYLRNKKVFHTTAPITFSALSKGMESGKPSMSIIIELENDTVVLAETSVAAFLTAAKAFNARYENEL